MDILIIIAQLLLSLSILVTLHEFGHFAAARMFGTRVEKFYLFFDFLFPFPDKWNFALWKKKIGDTEYGIGWFPMGGYVKIAGMMDESRDESVKDREPLPDEYESKTKWQKLIIMLGGVIVNFLLGYFIYSMVLLVWGREYIPMSELQDGIYVDSLGMEMGLKEGDKILAIGDEKYTELNPNVLRLKVAKEQGAVKVLRDGQEVTLTVTEDTRKKLLSRSAQSMELFGARAPFEIDSVFSDKPATQAGLQKGDRIVSVNEQATPFYSDFKRSAKNLKNKEVRLGYTRPNVDSTLYTTLTLDEEGKMGVKLHDPFKREKQEYNFLECFPAGFKKGNDFIGTQLWAFGQMFQGKIKATESLGGFGTIGNLFPTTWQWQKFWVITAMLSLILAIMNLLPIPLLDGGYVLFLLFEMITGKEIPEHIMEKLLTVGLYLVLGLMVFANGMDILRWLNLV